MENTLQVFEFQEVPRLSCSILSQSVMEHTHTHTQQLGLAVSETKGLLDAGAFESCTLSHDAHC